MERRAVPAPLRRGTPLARSSTVVPFVPPAAREYLFGGPDLHRSAELHSAVTQDCILQGVGEIGRVGMCDAPPIANRRYGRVQLCATLSTHERARSPLSNPKGQLGFSGLILVLIFLLLAGFVSLVAATEADGSEFLRLSASGIHDLKLHTLEDGAWEIASTGSDPYLFTTVLPIGLDLNRRHVLAFEYFSLTGIDEIQVFLVPPQQESVSVKSGGLSRNEGWSSHAIDLTPAVERRQGTVTALRVDFGRQANRTLRIRNLQLRAPTDQELAFAARHAALKEKEMELDRRVRDYLGRKFPCQLTEVRVNEGKIAIAGNVGSEAAEFFLIEVPIYTEVTETKSFANIIPIRANGEGKFSITLDRVLPQGNRTHDRLFSRWAVAQPTGDGYTLLSHARYPDIVEPKWDLPEEKPRGRKGLGALSSGRPLSDLEDLGIAAATVNISLNSFMRSAPGEGRTAFDYGGRTWYADNRTVWQLDRTLLEAAQRHLVVSAIILVNQAGNSPDREYGRLVAHPDAHPSGHYVMPNLTGEAGHAAYAAALDFLARRYSQPGQPYGRIHHWIMHNEVDAGWEWTNAGDKTALRYLDLYQRSMRTAHLIARQYDSHAKTFISLTHYWTQQAAPHFYPARDLLELLLDFSHAEGDFDWAIAHHPYPESLRNPRTWEDRQARFTFDTPQITFKNIEVLDAWVRQARTLFLGKHRRTVHLSEQGPNSPDYGEKSLREQAAALAYVWRKLKSLDAIEVFHYHNWVDNRGEGGLRIGLRRFPDDPDDPLGRKPVWHVFRALDTPAEDEATEFAKELIGIKNWADVPYRGEIK
jgi:hypothetical protein